MPNKKNGSITKQFGLEEYNKPDDKPSNKPKPAPKKDDDRRNGNNTKPNRK